MAAAARPLRVLVGCKRVIDYAVKVRIIPATGIDTTNVKHSLNPFDEIAVEEAVRLKAASVASETVAVSCGGAKSQEVLRTALAMGVDRAVHVDIADGVGGGWGAAGAGLQPLAVAKVLQRVVEKEGSDLVILGKQAIDDDSGCTGQMLAGLLNWPQATFASKIEMVAEGGADAPRRIRVTREVDGGLETIECALPAVVTADLRLNTPRYATLPNIMKAKKKPLEKVSLDGLGLGEEDVRGRLEVVSVEEPKKRVGGRIVESVDELVTLLRKDGVV